VSTSGTKLIGAKATPGAENIATELLESQLRQRFDVVEQRLTVGPFALSMLHPRSADDLISDDDFNRDERLPYWAEIWPSAYVLAERIVEFGKAQGLQPPGFNRVSRALRRPQLLELGCGCGLAVMVALAAGFDVTAIDYYPEALQFVSLNAQRNGLPAPKTAVVDWRNYPTDLVDVDVVVAADVLYERDYCRLIAMAFRQSLRPSGLGLLTDPQRTKAQLFPEECHRAGLQISETQIVGPISVPGGDPGSQQTVNVFEIRQSQ
jgi:ETFB lysine methyltransferase